jgi:hypothetical protein
MKPAPAETTAVETRASRTSVGASRLMAPRATKAIIVLRNIACRFTLLMGRSLNHDAVRAILFQRGRLQPGAAMLSRIEQEQG